MRRERETMTYSMHVKAEAKEKARRSWGELPVITKARHQNAGGVERSLVSVLMLRKNDSSSQLEQYTGRRELQIC